MFMSTRPANTCSYGKIGFNEHELFKGCVHVYVKRILYMSYLAHYKMYIKRYVKLKQHSSIRLTVF